MDQHRLGWCIAIACGVAMLLLAAAPPCHAGPSLGDGWGQTLDFDSGSSVSTAPGLDRWLHRLETRAGKSFSRVSNLLGAAGMAWFWILVSVVVFLLVTAVSSVVDFRMLDLRHKGPGALPRYLGNGTLTFFRILRDRRTPNIARGVLLFALVYWLVPLDLIPDNSVVPGFVDDLLIAVSAAKGFIYLCPDSLVARHAAAVEARA
jgi:hypothetical protein